MNKKTVAEIMISIQTEKEANRFHAIVILKSL